MHGNVDYDYLLLSLFVLHTVLVLSAYVVIIIISISCTFLNNQLRLLLTFKQDVVRMDLKQAVFWPHNYTYTYIHTQTNVTKHITLLHIHTLCEN